MDRLLILRAQLTLQSFTLKPSQLSFLLLILHHHSFLFVESLKNAPLLFHLLALDELESILDFVHLSLFDLAPHFLELFKQLSVVGLRGGATRLLLVHPGRFQIPLRLRSAYFDSPSWFAVSDSDNSRTLQRGCFSLDLM